MCPTGCFFASTGLVFSVHAVPGSCEYHTCTTRRLPELTLEGIQRRYDWVAFSSGAFSSTIISTVLNKPTLLRTGEYQLLLGAIALPGAFLGAFTIQYIGAKRQMMIGFVGYIVIGLIVGCLWYHIIKAPVAFVILYGLLSSLGNFGPGS